MKVFISWSGEKSKAVGELLSKWLPCVIQSIEPWMSNKDIDRGSIWFTEIMNRLQETSLGIVCLTNENKERPWILFESGALAKGLSTSRVIPLLIDLSSADIEAPLAQFNHTYPTKEGMLNLLNTLNTLSEKPLSEKILQNVFDTYWPQFEKEFEEISKSVPSIDSNKRSAEAILEEVLSLARSLDKRLLFLEVKNNITQVLMDYLEKTDSRFSTGLDHLVLDFAMRKQYNKEFKSSPSDKSPEEWLMQVNSLYTINENDESKKSEKE